MDATKQTGTDQPTPEQLILLLDAQLAAGRGKRGPRSRNRAIILVGGILFITLIGGISLMIAQQMMLDLQERGLPPEAAAATELR